MAERKHEGVKKESGDRSQETIFSERIQNPRIQNPEDRTDIGSIGRAKWSAIARWAKRTIGTDECLSTFAWLRDVETALAEQSALPRN